MAELEVRLLRAFVALAERGGVTVAAKALGVAQSTVSEALAALERAIGVPVMSRAQGRRAAQLTAEGEALLPHARAVLAAVDQARMSIASTNRSARATVEIAANESVSTYLLPPVLARLRPRWPNTRFAVSVAACGTAIEESGRFDVGILLQQDDDRSPVVGDNTCAVAAAEVAERYVLVPNVPLLVFAAPAHPLSRGRTRAPVPREALFGLQLFVTEGTGEIQLLVRRFFNPDRDGGVSIEATGSVEGVKKAVLTATNALGLLPAYAVDDDIRRHALVPLEIRPALPRV